MTLSSRQRWMSVIARATASDLKVRLKIRSEYTVLRGPEAGLVMVRGRAGGGGQPFNLGEITVTRCTVRTEAGFVGHAYIAGRDLARAKLAALTDALMQDPTYSSILEQDVITPLEQQQAAEKDQRAGRAAATRVQFFAMQSMRT